MTVEYLISVAQIILIDLVLSGDNAVVIAMAAHKLPERQRKKAIYYGGGIAILLRIVFTLVMAYLLLIPGVRLIGGLILVWVACKLLLDGDGEGHNLNAGSAEKSAWAAVRMIFIADLVMSLDNMLAVAGASHGDLTRLVLGLLVSIVIIMTCSALIARLMNRYKWIVFLGAAILAQTAAQMMIGDREVANFIAKSQQICLSSHWDEDYMLTHGAIPHFDSASWPADIEEFVIDSGRGSCQFIGPMSAEQRDLLLAEVTEERDKEAVEALFKSSQSKWPKALRDSLQHQHYVAWIFYAVMVAFCLLLPIFVRRRRQSRDTTADAP